MTTTDAPMPQQLSERLDFIGLDKQSLAAISAIRPLIERHLAGALDTFYAKLVEVPAVSRFFADAEQRDRAKQAQIGHWTGITGGFGAGYLESATRVGLRHARIGLDPRWYIGGYGLIHHRKGVAIGREKGVAVRSELTPLTPRSRPRGRAKPERASPSSR